MKISKPLLKDNFYFVRVATNNILNSLSTKGPFEGHLYENRVDMVLRADKAPVLFLNNKHEPIFRITPEEYATDYLFSISTALKSKGIAIDDNGYAVVLKSTLLETKEEKREEITPPADTNPAPEGETPASTPEENIPAPEVDVTASTSEENIPASEVDVTASTSEENTEKKEVVNTQNNKNRNGKR